MTGSGFGLSWQINKRKATDMKPTTASALLFSVSASKIGRPEVGHLPAESIAALRLVLSRGIGPVEMRSEGWCESSSGTATTKEVCHG